MSTGYYLHCREHHVTSANDTTDPDRIRRLWKNRIRILHHIQELENDDVSIDWAMAPLKIDDVYVVDVDFMREHLHCCVCVRDEYSNTYGIR